MKIEHIAIWVEDLELMKDFYVKYFGAIPNDLYSNATKKFKSYFLTFESGTRLELMYRPDIINKNENEATGYTHTAFSLGSKEKVNEMTETLRKDGFHVVGEPRTTGDGYYESVIKDPEMNLIELTI